MEPMTHDKPQQPTPIGGGNSPLSRDINSAADRAASAFNNASRQISDTATETVNQAKQKASELYDSVNSTVNDQYNRAVDYSRENPGKTTLIAFGVGVGVGVLLLGNLRGGPSRGRRRVVQPVMNALSTLAYELFA